MTLTCYVCKLEFPIPRISSKLYYKCPNCGTMIQLWGSREPEIKQSVNKLVGLYGEVIG